SDSRRGGRERHRQWPGHRTLRTRRSRGQPRTGWTRQRDPRNDQPACSTFSRSICMENSLMTTTTNTNGRVRTSLASQIDRLDSILDGLAEAINETVVDAVQAAVGQAVREAVQATLAEVLSNPQLRPLLQPRPAATEEATAPQRPPLLRRVAGWLAETVTRVWNTATARVRRDWAGIRSAVWGACTRIVTGVGTGLRDARARSGRAYARAAELLQCGWLRAWALAQLARRQARTALAALGAGVAVGYGC